MWQNLEKWSQKGSKNESYFFKHKICHKHTMLLIPIYYYETSFRYNIKLQISCHSLRMDEDRVNAWLFINVFQISSQIS